MAGVVCAIRRGPSSRATIAWAIALAQESARSLWVLYAVNLEFLGRTSTSRVRTIGEQRKQKDESIVLAAQARPRPRE